MPLKIPWLEDKNRGIVILLCGFATIIQFIIILLAAYYFPINSIYVFIFVSLGVILLLIGIEILFAELVHSLRVHRRQKKPIKKKKKLKKISLTWSIFIGAGIGLGLYSLLYFIFAYTLIDPFALTNIPIYGKFTLAEILASIILVIIILIFESTIPKK